MTEVAPPYRVHYDMDWTYAVSNIAVCLDDHELGILIHTMESVIDNLDYVDTRDDLLLEALKRIHNKRFQQLRITK